MNILSLVPWLPASTLESVNLQSTGIHKMAFGFETTGKEIVETFEENVSGKTCMCKVRLSHDHV